MKRHTCKHDGEWALTGAFGYFCNRCGREVEAVNCAKCKGTGNSQDKDGGLYECPKCKGAGVKRWRIVK